MVGELSAYYDPRLYIPQNQEAIFLEKYGIECRRLQNGITIIGVPKIVQGEIRHWY